MELKLDIEEICEQIRCASVNQCEMDDIMEALVEKADSWETIRNSIMKCLKSGLPIDEFKKFAEQWEEENGK